MQGSRADRSIVQGKGPGAAVQQEGVFWEKENWTGFLMTARALTMGMTVRTALGKQKESTKYRTVLTRPSLYQNAREGKSARANQQ